MSHNVVHKIQYIHDDCVTHHYVDQIDRILKARISKRKNHINWNQSLVTMEIGMNSIGNIKILDEKKILNKRLISEMIFIPKQKNTA